MAMEVELLLALNSATMLAVGFIAKQNITLRSEITKVKVDIAYIKGRIIDGREKRY